MSRYDILALIERLGNADELERRMAIAELSETGADSIPFLLASLKDSRPNTRAGAVTVLGAMQHESDEVSRQIAQLLADPVDAVRRSSQDALAKLGKNSVPLLEQCLQDTKVEVIAGSAIALGQIPNCVQSGSDDLLPKLAELMCYEDAFVRRQCAITFGKLVSDLPRYHEFLSKTFDHCIDSGDFQSAEEMAAALGETGTKSNQIAAILLSALHRGDERFKGQLLTVLRRLGACKTVSNELFVTGRLLAEWIRIDAKKKKCAQ